MATEPIDIGHALRELLSQTRSLDAVKHLTTFLCQPCYHTTTCLPSCALHSCLRFLLHPLPKLFFFSGKRKFSWKTASWIVMVDAKNSERVRSCHQAPCSFRHTATIRDTLDMEVNGSRDVQARESTQYLLLPNCEVDCAARFQPLSARLKRVYWLAVSRGQED